MGLQGQSYFTGCHGCHEWMPSQFMACRGMQRYFRHRESCAEDIKGAMVSCLTVPCYSCTRICKDFESIAPGGRGGCGCEHLRAGSVRTCGCRLGGLSAPVLRGLRSLPFPTAYIHFVVACCTRLGAACGRVASSSCAAHGSAVCHGRTTLTVGRASPCQHPVGILG